MFELITLGIFLSVTPCAVVNSYNQPYYNNAPSPGPNYHGPGSNYHGQYPQGNPPAGYHYEPYQQPHGQQTYNPRSFASPVFPERKAVYNDTAVLGYPAQLGQFPYQVSVQLNSVHLCGGAILINNAILTAAHCVDGIPPRELLVLAGTVNLQNGGIRSHVSYTKPHPLYNSRNLNNDAAIVFLQGPLPLSRNISPIKLPKQDEGLYAFSMVTITGWGGEGATGQLSRSLKYIHVPTLDHKICKTRFDITNSMICVGDLQQKRMSCPGDSGGPLVYGNVLVGIMSSGAPCGSYGQPTVFTYVAGIRTWIKDILRI